MDTLTAEIFDMIAAEIKAHDDLLFARYQGFYEYLMDGAEFGRTHESNQDWNEAYDEGRNDADSFLVSNDNNIDNLCGMMKTLLDRKVVLITASHMINGVIGESEFPDIIVLHTNTGLTHLAASHVIGFTIIEG